jgi:HlyD family secretion protein
MNSAKRKTGAAGRAVARISSDLTGIIRPRGPADDPTAPAILEYQWPSTAIINAPIPRAARGIAWIVTSMVFVMIALMGFIPVDQVVTARGIVVSKTPTILAQPLDVAIVRTINVREGQFVRAGALLASFDPTIAAADLRALQAQVSSYQAEVARLRAQALGKPYVATDGDPSSAMQATIFAHDQAEFGEKLDSYKQKIDELSATVARSEADIKAYQGRLSAAQDIEQMRKQLEAEQYGSHLNTLLATDSRLEMGRSLSDAQQTARGARRDLDSMVAERDAFVQGVSADTEQQLTDATRKLSDATQEFNKAKLHNDLVELRADRDAVVQSIAKVSVGSVLQSGEPFITLVPANAPLEVEANIEGTENGYVHVGDPVSIKFDTLPYTQYGTAEGTVRIVSPDSFTSQTEARISSGSVPATSSSEPFYRARIAVQRTALRNVPAGFRVIPGMPVSADIKVGRRTVLNYLLGRVMPYAQEGMREP